MMKRSKAFYVFMRIMRSSESFTQNEKVFQKISAPAARYSQNIAMKTISSIPSITSVVVCSGEAAVCEQITWLSQSLCLQAHSAPGICLYCN